MIVLLKIYPITLIVIYLNYQEAKIGWLIDILSQLKEEYHSSHNCLEEI